MRIKILLLLMIVLSPICSAMNEGSLDEPDESNVIKFRNFSIKPESKKNVEAIIGLKSTEIEKRIFNIAEFLSNPASQVNPQDYYDKFLTLVQGNKINPQITNAISSATLLAVIYPSIHTRDDVQHGVLLTAKESKLFSFVPLVFK